MNLKSLIQKTWTTGLLLFSILAIRKNKKTIDVGEVSSEDKTNEEESRQTDCGRDASNQ